MRDLVGELRRWRAEGVGTGRAIVVRVSGGAPFREGATLLVTDDGRLAGGVSGGCVEAEAAETIGATRRSGRPPSTARDRRRAGLGRRAR
jgi:xanthine dehydrogenase accessory factor